MAYVAPYMLATGDYSGRICIWNIITGERQSTLQQEAPEYQRGVEQLLFLRPGNPGAPSILLSCGGGCTCWQYSVTSRYHVQPVSQVSIPSAGRDRRVCIETVSLQGAIPTGPI